MKKREMFIKKSLFTSLLIVLLVSCASNSSNEKSNKVEKNEEISVPQLSEEELFIQEMNKYTIEFTNVPAKIKKGKTFASDFEAKFANCFKSVRRIAECLFILSFPFILIFFFLMFFFFFLMNRSGSRQKIQLSKEDTKRRIHWT